MINLKNNSLLMFYLFFSFHFAHPFFPFFSSTPKTVPYQHQPIQRPIIIMLEPAGDAQNTGRKIDDSFERSITLFFVEKLKAILEDQNANIKVILARTAGQKIEPLQNAHFANRLDVDLYVSINFFQESETKPRLYVYNFSYNDDFVQKPSELSFCPYEKAHLYHYDKTRKYAHIFNHLLNQEEYVHLFEFFPCTKLPFKPLIGIKSPALAIEAGLIKKNDWHFYLEPIALCLHSVIESIKK